MRRLEFRESGPPAKELTKQLPFYISELRAASLAVSFRIGGPQLSLPGMDVSHEMISELFDCVELFEAGNLEKLRERIENESYFRNFVGLSEKIAPDGENIRRVGFTAGTADRERRVALSRTRERIRQAAKALKPAQPEEQLTEVCGVLLEANAKSLRQGFIQLVDDDRKTHRFVVPRGMMSDIVRPMFEERVTVTAQREGQHLLLQSIRAVDDEPTP
ncbi:MAG: hypothetical protein JW759_07900 [Candidatus Coatesbacteria bacterium]|nr:hypothetical protein [Candidatus Coatesbacteria bacterium]